MPIGDDARVVAWRRIDAGSGHCAARLQVRSGGWTAHGVEVLVAERTVACWFRVDLDAAWRTREVEVRALDAAGERLLRLEAEDGRWTVDGRARTELDGCIDVDIAATPLTNTFPVRRLAGLATGEQRSMPVAWVDVPSLAVDRVEQTYARTGPRAWRYSDPVYGAFRIEVDDDGIVERYEGFAERIHL